MKSPASAGFAQVQLHSFVIDIRKRKIYQGRNGANKPILKDFSNEMERLYG
jgi:hypothetical protein